MGKISISDSEWKVMNLLWEQEPRTIMQLTKALQEETHWTKHTVITYLKRLEAKGAVYYEEGVKAKQFYSKVPRTEAELTETRSFLDKVFHGKVGLMISTMVQEEELTEEEIAELYEMLQEHCKK